MYKTGVTGLHAGYAGFPLITSRKLAVDFAAAIADLPGSGSAVQAYEDIVERPYKIEHLEHRVDKHGHHFWTYENLPVITDRSHAVAFAEGLEKLGPSPSATAVAKVYAETVDAGYTYEFLKLGRDSKKASAKRTWTCLGFGELDTITSRDEAVAFSAALQALDQKEPDHGFLLAEVGSLVEPYFNPKFTGVVKSGKNSWKAQFGSKYLGVHATSVAAAKAYDRHILETASDYQGRRLKTHLAKLNFPEVLLLSCKRAITA